MANFGESLHYFIWFFLHVSYPVIGIAVGTGLLCFALVVVVVVVVVVVWNVYGQHHQRGRQEVCQPQEDDPVSLPLCPRGYVLKSECRLQASLYQ